MPWSRINGWLFDVDELGPVVTLWVYDDDGRLHRLTEEFHPLVYASGEDERLKQLAIDWHRRGFITGVRWELMREFWGGEQLRVLQLNIADSSCLSQAREAASALDRELSFYNLDIPTTQYYLYLRKLFPLCRLECVADEHGQIAEVAALDSAWEVDHRLPPLRVMRLWGERLQPLNGESRILIEYQDEVTAWRFADGAGLIEKFNEAVSRADPDLILSDRGDSLVIPALLKLAARSRLPLELDRDRVSTRRKIETDGRTYFSYGRIIYKAPNYPLFGRWHIDHKNSFAHYETGLQGLLEMSRLARVPVQRMARTSPGTAMTSLQIERAINDRILVPWRKNEPEKPKTALQLLTVDKGGLTYQPRLGAYENIAEIDFASMYATIMVVHNISPETVLCSCCRNHAVPEAGYNVCEKRRGLLALVLEPLIERRRLYKKLMRETADAGARDAYEARRAAIKWMLVTCFGYLGYKNARFGRIEAHESVTAFGRETLLQAKEIIEAEGYRMLHALTDSLWIERAELCQDELQSLCERITSATGIEMSLEGVYRWIEFLPSKQKATRPVAARYFGVFADGSVKVRGLACRRNDTPVFIKEVQEELIAILATARTLAERSLRQQQAAAVLAERIAQLERGEIEPRRLIVEQVLSREIEDYLVETRAAIAARKMREAGINVHPGERVGYVIADAAAKDKSRRVSIGGDPDFTFDLKEYVRRLTDAAREVGVMLIDN